MLTLADLQHQLTFRVPDECTRWMYRMDVPDGCTRRVFQMNAPDECDKWVHQMSAPDECARWVRQMSAPDECIIIAQRHHRPPLSSPIIAHYRPISTLIDPNRPLSPIITHLCHACHVCHIWSFNVFDCYVTYPPTHVISLSIPWYFT